MSPDGLRLLLGTTRLSDRALHFTTSRYIMLDAKMLETHKAAGYDAGRP